MSDGTPTTTPPEPNDEVYDLLLGADYHRRDSAENRDALRGEVSAGDAGLLAYRDGAPIGWARLTPRSRLSWLTRRFSALTADDAAHPWSLPCFFVARNARGAGVMTALIRFAAQWADAHEVLLEVQLPDRSGCTGRHPQSLFRRAVRIHGRGLRADRAAREGSDARAPRGHRRKRILQGRRSQYCLRAGIA